MMIYFIRHGQTDDNVEKAAGQTNMPLNQVGVKQAKQVAIQMAKLKIDQIFCSPLERAKATAQFINQYHHAPMVFDERISERKHGEHTESDVQFFGRVKGFFDQIKNTPQNILIVSHGGVYRNLVRAINNNLDFEQKIASIGNCVLAELYSSGSNK